MDPVGRGAKLFDSRDLSESNVNRYTCATCHDTVLRTAGQDPSSSMAPLEPGAVMAGVTRRPSLWGGMESDLLAAVDDCRRLFMNDRDALSRDDPAVQDLYAYLVSLEPGDPAAVAFSVPTFIANIARGDAGRGTVLFARSCGRCHGELHTGHGRLGSNVPSLPEDVVASHASYDAETQRLIFIEKTRHGGFFGYSGVMPPFSEQALPDDQLADILETLGVLGSN
jgi:thiosulfate dehydrogenase